MECWRAGDPAHGRPGGGGHGRRRFAAAGALAGTNARREGAAPAGISGSGSGLVAGNATTIASRTVNGQTTLVYRGREFALGVTEGPVVARSVSVEGKEYAAAFAGSNVVWENVTGAADHLK